MCESARLFYGWGDNCPRDAYGNVHDDPHTFVWCGCFNRCPMRKAQRLPISWCIPEYGADLGNYPDVGSHNGIINV